MSATRRATSQGFAAVKWRRLQRVLVVGALALLVLTAGEWLFLRWRGLPVWSTTLCALAAAVIGTLWSRRDIAELKRDGHAYRTGAQGEVRAAEILAPLEAQAYRVYHNFDLKLGTKGGGDIDHLVVGPTGVFAVDVKAWTRPVYLAKGAKLMCGRRSEERSVSKAIAHTIRLRRLLEQHGVQVGYIKTVIALTHVALPKGQMHFDHLDVIEAVDLPTYIRSARGHLSLEKFVEIERALTAIEESRSALAR